MQEANRRYDEAHERVELAHKQLDQVKEALTSASLEDEIATTKARVNQEDRKWQRAVVDRDGGEKAIEAEIKRAGSVQEYKRRAA